MITYWSATLTLMVLLAAGCQDSCSRSTGNPTPADGGSGTNWPTDTGPSDDTGAVEVDQDGDGFTVTEGDCADADASVHPGQLEVPGNGVDEDCDASDAGPTSDLADATAVWEGEEYSMAGHVVELGGDIDGDGISDLLVGAPWEAVPGEAVDNPGTVYVVSGEMPSGGLGAATAVIVPDEANAGTGRSFAGGDDLNGDGYDDVAVGLFLSEVPSDLQGGRVLVFLGPLTGLLTEGDADTEIWTTREKAQFGYGLALLGRSGYVDGALVVGAPAAGAGEAGEAYVWRSVPAGRTDEQSASSRIVGSEPNAKVAVDLDGSTDLTGDGVSDLVVSESEAGGVGVLHVLAGPDAGFVDLSTDSTQFRGSRSDGEAGRYSLPHPDANGDGYPDLLVAAPLDPEVDTRGGKVWLLQGPLTEGGLLDDAAAAAILPEGGYEWLGRSLASPRDLDGDGLSDFAIGAPRDYYFGGDYPGKVYLFPSTISGTVSGAAALAVLQGERPGDYAAGAMAGGFDGNRDGLGDLVIGASGVNGTGLASGRVYLVTSLP